MSPRRAIDFQQVFEQCPALFLLLDPALTIVTASDAYAEATMTERTGLVGRHLFDAFPDNPDDPEATGTRNLAASLERVRRTRGPDSMPVQKYDVRRHDDDGGSFEERYWSPVNTPVLDAQNRLLAIIHRVDDVTELVRQRDTATQSTERASELEQRLFLRSKELEQANERLLEVDRLKSDFLARMSHELRTPLNSVIGFAQLLEMDDLDDAQAQSVRDISRAGHHLLNLINEVLDIAQIESDHLALSVEPVAVPVLVSAAMKLVQPIAARQSVALVAPLDPGDAYVLADQQRAVQVLLNLLSNAVKYNRPNGTVRLSVETTEADVRFSVTDTGYGIPTELRHRLFSAFDRLGKEQTDIEGTGVGLLLARELAARMGGALELATTDDDGSTFVLELPRAAMPLERSGIDGSDGPVGYAPHAGLRPMTILYIEDNLTNLRLVAAAVARLPKVTLLTAMQGRLGLELAAEHEPDLILLDVHLPDMNGDEVYAHLREQPLNRSTPIVFLSADATPSHVERLRALGADDYLTKPINITELLREIERVRDDL